MAKLFYLFVMALCLAQNFQRSVANSEEDENENAIANFLKLELVDVFQELSDNLISNYYEPDVKKNIKANNITIKRIFKIAKEEIADLFDDSSAEECFVMAYEELDSLNEKTKGDVDHCIAKGTKRTTEVINEAEQDIMTAVTSIAEDMLMKMAKCSLKFKEDDMWVSNCLNFKEITKMKKAAEEITIDAAEVSQLILQQIAEDVGACLKQVKIDALINTEHVVDEFKYCIN